MRMHSTFIGLVGLVGLASLVTMASCGSSTATTSTATTIVATTAIVDATTTPGSGGPDAPTVAASQTAIGGTTAAAPTTPHTASPGVTAPRGSIVAAPGRVVPATTAAVGVVDASLQATIDLAVADLAKQLQVDASAITTVSAKSVEWPDKSDGCPQPGMSYPQVPVDGALVVLSSSGLSYEYHSGGSRTPFLCKKS